MHRFVWRVMGVSATLAVVLSVSVATATAGGGKSDNAKLCRAAWSALRGSNGSGFAGQDLCVSYAAEGGTLYGLFPGRFTGCQVNVFEEVFVGFQTVGFSPPTLTATLAGMPPFLIFDVGRFFVPPPPPPPHPRPPPPSFPPPHPLTHPTPPPPAPTAVQASPP